MLCTESLIHAFHVWAWELLDVRGNCVAQAVVRGPTLEIFSFEAPVSSLGCRNYWSPGSRSKVVSCKAEGACYPPDGPSSGPRTGRS